MNAKERFLYGYKLLMSSNQIFNRFLYAPLTRTSLDCRPAIYFTRKVCMNRRPILRRVVSAAALVQMSLLLCTVPIRAQSGAPPGMDEASPFDSSSGRGPSTFSDRTPPPEQHVLTADHAPGDVHGVTRYPGGLPMPGAQVVILNADVDVERFAVSAEDGSFSFSKLKPGHYQLSAKVDGFEPSEIMTVDVIPGKIVNSDISLKSAQTASLPSRTSENTYRTYNGGYHTEAASLRVASPQPTAAASSEGTGSTTDASSAANTPATGDVPKATETPSSQPVPSAVADELESMRKRIDELESELKGRGATDAPAAETPAAAPAIPAPAQDQAAAPVKLLPGQYLAAGGTATYFQGDTDIPTHPDGWDPFSYADWTWMNANGRQHDSPWSTKYFTPEFRADVNYVDDFNHPRDDTMGGSTESFRSNEWQL